jgi:exonuclease III
MMKIITWNIRGLNSKSKQRILRDCIKEESPNILMLQEMKCAGMEAEIIFQRIWKGCNYIHTDSVGASGGLAILWNPNHTILSGPFSTIGTLSAHFEVIGSNQEGIITNVYGPQGQQEKIKFMERLTQVKSLATTLNWILGGDFNMIMSLEEKKSKSKRLEQDNGKFKILPEQLKFVDIENNNGTFTWSNRRSRNHHVACRLDHFLVTKELIKRDLYMESLILPKEGSDHWPITLQIAIETTPKFKPFRFEKF